MAVGNGTEAVACFENFQNFQTVIDVWPVLTIPTSTSGGLFRSKGVAKITLKSR
jgi:hypothetical protein